MLFHIRRPERLIFFRLLRQVQVQDASFPIFPHSYAHIHPLVVKFHNTKQWWRQQCKPLVTSTRSDWNVTSYLALTLKTVSRFNDIKKDCRNMIIDTNMSFWMWFCGRFEVRIDDTEEGISSIMTVEMNMRIVGFCATKPYDVTSQNILRSWQFPS